MMNISQVLWALMHSKNHEMSRKELLENTSLKESQLDKILWDLRIDHNVIQKRREKINKVPYIKAYYRITNLKQAKFLLKSRDGLIIEDDS